MIDSSQPMHVVWRKSSRSGSGQECLELAGLPNAVAVRDSKDPDGPRLGFSRAAWRRFSEAVRDGAYDG